MHLSVKGSHELAEHRVLVLLDDAKFLTFSRGGVTAPEGYSFDVWSRIKSQAPTDV